MAAVLTPINHIRIDKQRRAWIEGTPFKVVEIVLDHTVSGMSPVEIAAAFPGQITLAQVHAALAYYFDHKKSIDSEIKREDRLFVKLSKQTGQTPEEVRQKPKARSA